MRIHASLLPVVLGLLPSLVKAAAEVPLYSTLEEPFVLSVQEDFRIVLKWVEEYNDYEPQLSRAKTELPAFKLTAGNLTTVGGPVKEGYTAFNPKVGANPPPSLSPVWFDKNAPRDFVPPVVAFTHRSGILRLWSINGRQLIWNKPAPRPFEEKTDCVLCSIGGSQTRGRRASSSEAA